MIEVAIAKLRLTQPVRVGVLNGYTIGPSGETPCQPRTSRFSAQDWADRLKEETTFEVKLIPSSDVGGKFDVVVNPMGETYPEEDLAQRTTFHRIRRFVLNGGMFVNVGGLPFFWMWNTRPVPGSEKPTGKTALGFTSGQGSLSPQTLVPVALSGQFPVSGTWFEENFGVRTTIWNDPVPLDVYQTSADEKIAGTISGEGGSSRVTEWRAVAYAEDLAPILRAVHPSTIECYPIAVLKRGLGYLVSAGLALDRTSPEDHTQSDFQKILKAILGLCRTIRCEGRVLARTE